MFAKYVELQILYYHGGGFVYEIMSVHWEFFGRLTDALHCTITVPIYPCSPIYGDLRDWAKLACLLGHMIFYIPMPKSSKRWQMIRGLK